MKLIIQKIGKSTQSKDGKPYIDKYGKQKTRVYFTSDQHGDKYISGFVYANSPALNWQMGDTVEVDIKEENGFLNFYLPKPTVSRQEFDELKKVVENLVRFTGFQMPTSGNVRMVDPDSGMRIPARIPKNDEGLPQIDIEEGEPLPF